MTEKDNLDSYWGAQVLSHFNFMQNFRFHYQIEGKRLENNFDPSVKLSDKNNQNGRQIPRWLPAFCRITFVLLNTNRDNFENTNERALNDIIYIRYCYTNP